MSEGVCVFFLKHVREALVIKELDKLGTERKIRKKKLV